MATFQLFLMKCHSNYQNMALTRYSQCEELVPYPFRVHIGTSLELIA